MKRKKKIERKTLLMVLCLCTFAAIVIIGTYGYRMYTQNALTNTFTIGEINAVLTENGAQTGNTYELAWDKSYEDFDVSLDVKSANGSFYAFLVVNNELKDVESSTLAVTNDLPDGYTPIHDQMIQENSWTEKSTQGNVTIYYKVIPSESGSYPVVNSFRTKPSFSYDSFGDVSPKIEFTLYTIEKKSLDVNAAWSLLKETYNDKLGSY